MEPRTGWVSLLAYHTLLASIELAPIWARSLVRRSQLRNLQFGRESGGAAITVKPLRPWDLAGR